MQNILFARGGTTVWLHGHIIILLNGRKQQRIRCSSRQANKYDTWGLKKIPTGTIHSTYIYVDLQAIYVKKYILVSLLID